MRTRKTETPFAMPLANDCCTSVSLAEQLGQSGKGSIQGSRVFQFLLIGENHPFTHPSQPRGWFRVFLDLRETGRTANLVGAYTTGSL